jgi:membrane protease subunit (stomatin/prohibitin family)
MFLCCLFAARVSFQEFFSFWKGAAMMYQVMMSGMDNLCQMQTEISASDKTRKAAHQLRHRHHQHQQPAPDTGDHNWAWEWTYQ